MIEEIKSVSTGQVTYAVRDTVIDNKEIKQGDYMGIGDSGILSNGTDLLDVTFRMIEDMMEDDKVFVKIRRHNQAGDSTDHKHAQNPPK